MRHRALQKALFNREIFFEVFNLEQWLAPFRGASDTVLSDMRFPFVKVTRDFVMVYRIRLRHPNVAKYRASPRAARVKGATRRDAEGVGDTTFDGC